MARGGRRVFLACFLCIFCVFAFGCAGKERRFTILYTSDAHGHIASDAKTVGLDKVAALAAGTPDSLLLDAGDFLHGTTLATADNGASVVRLMKKAGYFAAALGNHEFDYGVSELLKRAKEAGGRRGMHMLSANVRRENGELLVAPSAQTRINGMNVCVFGLTTESTPMHSMPSSVAGLVFSDVVAEADTITRTLRKSGCDVVIALTHVGSDDRESVKSTDIAAAIPGIDAVIDGHSHRRFYTASSAAGLIGAASSADAPVGALPSADTSVGTASAGRALAVTSPGAHGERVGVMGVVFDTDKKRVTSLSNTFLGPDDLALLTPDAGLQTQIAALVEKEERRLSEVITEIPFALPATKKDVRTRELPLANIVADAFRRESRVDFAIVNGGDVRAGLPQGTVRMKHLAEMLPYGGPRMVFRIRGKELRSVLEHGYSFLPAVHGAFPQLSGLRVVVRANKPKGQRIISLRRTDGTPIRPDAEYSVAISDFLASGGDGYPVFSTKTAVRRFLSPVTTTVGAYLKTCDFSAYREAEGRIVFK